MVDTLRERAVDEIEDQCESQTILNGPLPIHIRRGRIRDNINAKLNAALSKIGGREGAITYLGEVLGGVVSLAMHDEDNKHGLWVSSKAHPQPWMAFGDSNLNAPMISNPLEAGMHMLHKQLIEKAIQVSLSDLQKAYVIGFEKFQQKHNLVSPKYLPDKIYFDFDSDRLNKKNLDTISMLADYLHFHPSTFVNLNGHTDPTGKADYNMDLSIRRANAVKSSLVALGVPADRLHSAGFGKTQLITRNPKQYQKDRRVEFVYQSRPTGVMDDPEKIAFGDVMKEIESKVGPPYAAEDHFPHEVPDNGANLPLNSPLPAWKWGSMSETLRVQINDTIKGYLGDLKSKIATAKELDDTEVSGYTIKIRPVVEKIFDELAADPLGFLGGLMGRKVN